MEYDVFISYSRKDSAIANKICECFNQVGISYFIDRKGIGGGMEFPAVLAEAIEQSTIFLFLASEHSYISKFTSNEILYAFNEKPQNSLLPYIIDGSKLPKNLRFTFASINIRNINEHPIETTLIDDILKLLKIENHNIPDSFSLKEPAFAIYDSPWNINVYFSNYIYNVEMQEGKMINYEKKKSNFNEFLKIYKNKQISSSDLLVLYSPFFSRMPNVLKEIKQFTTGGNYSIKAYMEIVMMGRGLIFNKDQYTGIQYQNEQIWLNEGDGVFEEYAYTKASDIAKGAKPLNDWDSFGWIMEELSDLEFEKSFLTGIGRYFSIRRGTIKDILFLNINTSQIIIGTYTNSNKPVWAKTIMPRFEFTIPTSKFVTIDLNGEYGIFIDYDGIIARIPYFYIVNLLKNSDNILNVIGDDYLNDLNTERIEELELSLKIDANQHPTIILNMSGGKKCSIDLNEYIMI